MKIRNLGVAAWKCRANPTSVLALVHEFRPQFYASPSFAPMPPRLIYSALYLPYVGRFILPHLTQTSEMLAEERKR